MLYDTRYDTLREELAAARVKAGLTQSELGKRMGKVQSFVSKIETGERYIDVLEFLCWCEAAQADAHRVLRRVQKTGSPRLGIN
jgi:transcriptional regulator with XRE-family HTH domain